MIAYDTIMTSLGACVATLTLLAALAYVAPSAQRSRAIVMALRWSAVSKTRAAIVLLTLAAGAAACFSEIAVTRNQNIDAHAVGADSTSAVFAAAPSAADVPAAETPVSDDSDRALAKLRLFAERIRGKGEAIAALQSRADADSVDGSAPLPDVETMTARLAQRLEAEPDNVDGWRMLGWAYFNTGRFSESEKAYREAVTRDPNNADLKLALEEAHRRASAPSPIAANDQPADSATERAGAGGVLSGAPENAADQSAMIAQMVDRLASRLETSPNDADGWLKLVRARTVLGQSDLAKDALRRALATFADDKAVRDRIATTAGELGISAY
ncbi:MAG: tetratricopeptide repeat protein [Hyphomicrobium sp.]